MNGHPQIKRLEYDYITDGIYIGTNQCCQTHFDEKLKQEGIEVDISLEEERVDAPFGVRFYIWIPIKNHTAPTSEQLDFGVATIEKLLSLKKKIYVHCQNGHGRAPTMVAAYLIKKGKSVDEAINFIKAKRPTIHLEEVQKQALLEWSKSNKTLLAKNFLHSLIKPLRTNRQLFGSQLLGVHHVKLGRKKLRSSIKKWATR
ncbi:dual specificity protein phosphatase family protein [Candidatus Amesbacteria bacterium]|nr:dual specificity protein phosphatase family protein [Candidatus Amesbacteria bacterium]